jgi:hypothetical protein
MRVREVSELAVEALTRVYVFGIVFWDLLFGGGEIWTPKYFMNWE